MNLNRLTCTPEQSAQLIKLGITPAAFLWHFFRGETWETEFMPFEQVASKICVPAWTKAELDAMIGPAFPKPDLWADDRIKTSKNQNPNAYPVFQLHKCDVFENGAEASAFGLIRLLELEYVEPDQINARYRKIFLKQSSLYGS